MNKEFIIFSKNETDIINIVIKSIHNNNTIYLSETFYSGFTVVLVSMRNYYINYLKNVHGVNNDIIQSFYKNNSLENIKKGAKIDKNNIFNFDFTWYNWIEDKIDLLNNYEKISVSRFGFNEKETKALIFLEMYRDKIKGFGSFYLLEKKTEKWIISKTIKVHSIIRYK